MKKEESIIMASSILSFLAVIVIVVVAVAGLYAALTFQMAVVGFQVSFAVGADQEQREFEVPVLHDKVQVEVVISSGSALWRASITDAEGDEIWKHGRAQGDRTTYTSDWLKLQSGHYNFTFGTIGIGELNANIRVTSKGGFW